MADNEAILKVLVETRDAIRDLKGFQDEAQKSVSGVESALGSLKSVAAAAVAFFAGKEVVGFFQDGIKAAVAQQDAMAKLGKALELTGGRSDEALKSFETFADEMEKVTKFADDVILSQAAIAKSFGVTNDQAVNLVKAAIQLSARFGGDLEGNVQALGKTFAGVTGKLDEQVVSLKSLTKEQLRSGAAIEEIIKQLGDPAKNVITTYSGLLDQNAKAHENVKEAFGAVIVSNQALLQQIRNSTATFQALEKVVKDNKDELGELVSFGVKAFATGFPVAIEVLDFFLQHLRFTVQASGVSFRILVGVIDTAVDGISAAIKAAANLFFGFYENILRGTKFLPGFSEALGVVGLNAEGAADSIAEINSSFNGLVDAGNKGVNEARNAVDGFANGINTGFAKAIVATRDFGKSVDAAAQKIFDADEASVQSAKKASEARAQFNRNFIDPKEIEKLKKEFQAFSDQVQKNSADETEKILNDRDIQIRKAQEFAAKLPQFEQEAQNLIVKIREDAQKKVEAIEEKADKERRDRLKAEIQDISSNPIRLVVEKIDVGADVAPAVQKEIGLSIGALGKLLDGAAGAKDLISKGAGAFADAFIPGIGGAVGSIVSKLQEGPEATKKFIKEFVGAVPELIKNIIDSIPAVAEALVDSLVNSDLIIKLTTGLAGAGDKIAISLINSAPGFIAKLLEEIPKLAIDFAKNFLNPSNFTALITSITTAVPKIITGLVDQIPVFIQAIVQQIPDIVKGLVAAVPQLILAIVNGVPDIILSIVKNVPDIILALVNGIPTLIEAIIGQIPFIIKELGKAGGAIAAQLILEAPSISIELAKAGPMIALELIKATPGIAKSLVDAFLSQFSWPEIPAPGWLSNFTHAVEGLFKTPGWIDDFNDAINRFAQLNPFGGGGDKGGGGGAIASFGKKLGFADGGVIPPGFPRDSGQIAVTSKERVLTDQQTDSFDRLVDALTAGNIAPGGNAAPTTIILQVGEQQLAKVMLNLNRQGFRTA